MFQKAPDDAARADVRGDRPRLHAFEQRIARIARLFQHTLVKHPPLHVTVQMQPVVFGFLVFHGESRKEDSRTAPVLRPDKRREVVYPVSVCPDPMRISLAFALTGLSVIAIVSVAASSSGEKTLKQQIESILAPVTQSDTPGFVILVKRNATIDLEKGYGVRELRTRTANDPQTNFRLASFTKQFTAMAIMLLVHDGKLRYEDHLTDVFPEFPLYGKTITIRNLLNHTSGLPDYEDLMEKEANQKGTIWSPEHQIQDDEVLRLLAQAAAGRFAPGTRWAYSNSGYVVLGLVVAKISGMPYRDFLQKRIFAPAGMRHSVVYQKGINKISDRAFGHSLEGGRWTQTDQSSTSATLGDGGVYSNLEDLAKWDEALQNHTLLSEQEMTAALTAVKLADGSTPNWPTELDGDNLAPGRPVSYGFGWFLDPYKNQTRMWHTGTTMGFRTVIQRFPADHFTIIILANRADLDTKALADKVADQLLK